MANPGSPEDHMSFTKSLGPVTFVQWLLRPPSTRPHCHDPAPIICMTSCHINIHEQCLSQTVDVLKRSYLICVDLQVHKEDSGVWNSCSWFHLYILRWKFKNQAWERPLLYLIVPHCTSRKQICCCPCKSDQLNTWRLTGPIKSDDLKQRISLVQNVTAAGSSKGDVLF